MLARAAGLADLTSDAGQEADAGQRDGEVAEVDADAAPEHQHHQQRHQHQAGEHGGDDGGRPWLRLAEQVL